MELSCSFRASVPFAGGFDLPTNKKAPSASTEGAFFLHAASSLCIFFAVASSSVWASTRWRSAIINARTSGV